MVFEVMGDNLLALIKRYEYRGIPLELVKIISLQTLIGLEFLHNECGIIHTDLKPENFLIAPTEPFDVVALQNARKVFVAHEVAERLEEAKKKMANKQLSKNQKKRLKAKLKKKNAEQLAAVGAGGASNAVDNETKEEIDVRSPSSKPRKMTYEEEKEEAHKKGLDNINAHRDPHAASFLNDEENKNVPTIQFHCKIGDLGNACWVDKHFTDDVTTRQYRAPEVIVGCPYGPEIDIWSLACLVFELVTGDYLFDPKEDPNHRHTRDEDHLALMIELLGEMPKKLTQEGKFSKQYFTRKGELKNITELDEWGLRDVLVEKYKLSDEDADGLSSFLLPMLEFNPAQRISASDAMKHPWLSPYCERWKEAVVRATVASMAVTTIANNSSSAANGSFVAACNAGPGAGLAAFTIPREMLYPPKRAKKERSSPEEPDADDANADAASGGAEEEEELEEEEVEDEEQGGADHDELDPAPDELD